MATPIQRIYWNAKRFAWWLNDRPRFGRKAARELLFWQGRWYEEDMQFRDNRDYYRRIMLAVAGEDSESFLQGKVVADFGCGPRGSLCWAEIANERIGIDLLVEGYKRFGISHHNMRYVQSTETNIPLPSACIDFLFSLNAMDHVADFSTMSAECVRVLASGGDLIATFNLDVPPTTCEPQTLTEAFLSEHLLSHLQVLSCRIVPRGPGSDPYRHFFGAEPSEPPCGPRIMWVRARKRL